MTDVDLCCQGVADVMELEPSRPTHTEGQGRRLTLTDYFRREPCFYTQSIYKMAARVYGTLRHASKADNAFVQKREEERVKQTIKVSPQLDFDNETDKRLTFELSFATLKYQDVLEIAVTDCSLFSRYPELKEDSDLVYVMLYDFQSRKFQTRYPKPGEVIHSDVTDIERIVMEMKTRLNASLARLRVQADAWSIRDLLPDIVRSREHEADQLQAYAWVNQLKTSISDVVNQFKEEGFQLEQYMVSQTLGMTFCVDGHCPDLLVFPADKRRYLEHHTLVNDDHIVLQDKSSCLGPHSVKALVNEGDDVMHVNVTSGLTTAHISSLVGNSVGTVWGLGVRSDDHLHRVSNKIRQLGAHNVKVLTERFLDLDPEDHRFRNVKIIYVTAECSQSGVSDPVSFIIQEDEDMSILHHLAVGETDNSRLGELIAKETLYVKHAMTKYTQVKAVVYTTRSINSSENEKVIGRSLDHANSSQQRISCLYRLTPPLVSISENDIDHDRIRNNCLYFERSDRMAGCFCAVISKEAEDSKQKAKETLARAAALGLLGSDKQAESLAARGQSSLPTHDAASRKRRSPRRTKSVPVPRVHHSKPEIKTNVKSNKKKNTTKKILGFGTSTRRKSLESIPKTSSPKKHENVSIVHHPSPFSSDDAS